MDGCASLHPPARRVTVDTKVKAKASPERPGDLCKTLIVGQQSEIDQMRAILEEQRGRQSAKAAN